MGKLPAIASKKLPAQITPLQLYLQEIAKYPLLEPEEELELAIQHFDHHNVQAAHRLVTSNLRLVVKIANDFRKAQASLLDLIQEGTLGLMQAVKKFNPYKGVKLSSYAAWWIRAYILKYLMDHRGQVKIATTAAQRKLFYNLQRETERLLTEYDTVDTKLIASSLDVPEKDVIEMQKRLGSSDYSLDAPITRGEETGLRHELFIDEQAQSIDDLLSDEQIKKIFHAQLSEFKTELNPRDLAIFLERIISENPLTLQEVGDKFGITRERARQIEVNILKKLKKFVKDKGTLDCLP